MIRRYFGVFYHPAHVYRLLQSLEHSFQRPVDRASQRNEAAIAAWWRERWPALKKEAHEEGRTIIWVDQSGFALLPMAVRTWAPRRHTPLLRVPLTLEHLAAIEQTIPNQVNKPTDRSTMRWVFQCFEGIDLLSIRHGPDPTRAVELGMQLLHQQVLALLGPSYEVFYKSTN